MKMITNKYEQLNMSNDSEIKLPKHWIPVLIDILAEYSEWRGNAGCNDKAWPSTWTEDQKIDFLKRFYYFNSEIEKVGDPEWKELQEDIERVKRGSKLVLPDFAFADLIADFLLMMQKSM